MSIFPTVVHISQIAAAVVSRQPLPAMQCENIEEGYQAQRKLTARINGGSQSNLKAGVTAEAVQRQLGLQAPLIGSLYHSGRLQSGCELTLAEGQELECEIGVVVDGAGSPVGLVPVVEVVYLAFSRREDFSITDALAVNLGADRYICGDVAPWDPGLAEVAINVWKDDVQVATVINEYSFGSPDCGASWIVAEATKRNLWQPGAENCLLILGTCGAPLKGEKGNYRFAFGELGEVCLRVR